MVKGRGFAWYIPHRNAVCSDEEIIIRGKKSGGLGWEGWNLLTFSMIER